VTIARPQSGPQIEITQRLQVRDADYAACFGGNETLQQILQPGIRLNAGWR
jgi:hypothetical protein